MDYEKQRIKRQLETDPENPDLHEMYARILRRNKVKGKEEITWNKKIRFKRYTHEKNEDGEWVYRNLPEWENDLLGDDPLGFDSGCVLHMLNRSKGMSFDEVYRECLKDNEHHGRHDGHEDHIEPISPSNLLKALTNLFNEDMIKIEIE